MGKSHGRVIDEWEFQPVIHLAQIGMLTEAEVDLIREAALEAAGRVGTDAERRGSTVAISEDRSAVRLAIRMDQALGEEPGDYGIEEPGYED